MPPAADRGGVLVAPGLRQRLDPGHADGRRLATPDQPARSSGGGHAVLGDHLAGHHGRDVPVGGLVEPAAPRGQVVGDHRLVQPQRAVRR